MSEGAHRHFTVFGFQSTHDALTAEAAIASAGLPLTVMPTPKSLGALCGIALRIADTDVADARAAMTGAGIAWSGSVEMLDR